MLFILAITTQQLQSQCNPPMAETCDESYTFCSLGQLNGYSCSNTSTIPSPCSPICSQGGVSHNTSWWNFVTAGGNMTITMNVGGCTTGQGIGFGIWGNCVCSEEIICHSNPCALPGSVNTISANLKPCKTYFLWVDGCGGDICNFTINTSGGGAPTLSPLGFINNKSNQIIDICAGSCAVTLSVNPQPGGCEPTYVWTIDGNELGYGGNSISYDGFNQVGDFIICVTAYIGNPQSGSVCAQQGPQCATLRVRKQADKTGSSRVICWDQANPSGYKWYSKKIYNSGTYRQEFFSNCCLFDSLVEFIVLDPPEPAHVYFIGCDNQQYVDYFGNKHLGCLHDSRILLPKTTYPGKCDSSILLTALNVEFAANWSIECGNGNVELQPNIHIIKPCNAGESYQFEYKWYKKSDPAHIIGSNERLLVNSKSEDYCLEVSVRTTLENQYEVCAKTFCETFDEGNLTPECSFILHDSKVFCFDTIADYWIDSIKSQNIKSYSWTVYGGNIISNPDSSTVQVRWLMSPKDTGKICVSYITNCDTSCQKCKAILFQTKIAGDDIDKRGLDAYLDAKPNPNGSWRLISGPHQVHIDDPSNPRTRISAFNYGYYCFEWTISTPTCVMKDTMCVNLHTFPTVNPEYPHLLFFERAGKISDPDQTASIIFTPNLIENNGESYLSIESKVKAKLNYQWFDVYGRSFLNNNIIIDSGNKKVNITSPIHSGMYFLVIEINGVLSVRKICVIEH